MKRQSISVITFISLVIPFIWSCSSRSATPASAIPSPTFTPIPTVVEPGLTHGYPCKPPCWRDLWPGRSTGQEVEQVMEQLRLDGWAKEIVGNSLEEYDIWPLSTSTPVGWISVVMDSNTVKTIKSDILFDYHLSKVIEQFGAPERVWPPIKSLRCTSCDNVEFSTDSVWSTRAYLLYPEQGLLFVMQLPPEGKGCMCPDMRIFSFCYYKPLPISEALDNNYLANLCTEGLSGVTEEDLVEWNGFGGGY